MTLSYKTNCLTIVGAIMGLMLASPAIAMETASRTIDDLTWVEGGPGLHFAAVWGDWTKDDYGMIVKIKAGHEAPRHSHTSDYHGVTIQGNWVHTYGEKDHRELASGGYAFQAGGEEHGDRCEGPQDCLILIHQHGPRDFLLPSN